MAASAILLIGVSVWEALYSEYTKDPFDVQYRMESRFDSWQTVLVWILFYGILLYVEQWCLRRNDSRQLIRKKQLWVIATIMLAQMVLTSLGGVRLWYIPLGHVGSPNTLEDYGLWWFSLYIAVSFLPLCFFSTRKTIRLFKNDAQWLTLSAIIPQKVTALISLLLSGVMAWQIQEYRSASAWVAFSEVPEYTEARAMGHMFQAMIWGLALIYTICLLIKQTVTACRAKHKL